MAIISPQPTTKLYKQEGKTGMYQSMLWALAVAGAKTSTVPVGWGEYFVYFKNNYLGVYWDENGFEKVAKAVLEKAENGLPAEWQAKWKQLDTELTEACRELVTLDLSAPSLDDLQALYERLFALDQAMWSHTIFIDTFDPGFDQEKMKEIAEKVGLAEEEVQALVTPRVPAYITEWALALEDVRSGRMTREELRHRFYWYATDYWQFGELSDEFVNTELAKPREMAFISPEKEQQEIMEKHGLSENPLATFETLTTWRDDRKRLNYTGLYGLMKVLREALGRQSIDAGLASAVLPHQVPDLFAGTLGEEILRKQLLDGVLFHVDADGHGSLVFGEDAQKSWEGLDAVSQGEVVEEVRGMTASRGRVTGRVCIVPHITNHNATLMQPGDILVTSMTRPEFVPLMKLAGGIVTNEGGITSHAAIVSRELGKPCIIGTKVAMKVLKQGDMVEVDADKGIVRKIG